jgi:hypothetical protein
MVLDALSSYCGGQVAADLCCNRIGFTVLRILDVFVGIRSVTLGHYIERKTTFTDRAVDYRGSETADVAGRPLAACTPRPHEL